MFIYADESGNTGRHIFNEPRFYFQGALFSTTDLEPILSPVIDHYCSKLSISRIHAKNIPSHIVFEIACSIIDSIQDNNWKFHVTVIEKPYLAITKFVDSIFDSGENIGARRFWYERISNTELSPEQIQRGNDLKEEIENIHQEGLRKFINKQVDKKTK